MKVAAVEQVAETQFHLRRILLESLQRQLLTDDTAAYLANLAGGRTVKTYGDWFQTSHGLDFFDASTLVRLGTAIEVGLNEWYRGATGGRRVSRGAFQRLHDDELTTVRDETGVDLTAMARLSVMRLVMAHRHLYAHRSGLLDARFIAQVLNLTGEDITPEVNALGWYSDEDEVYWFKPLRALPTWIEETRSFFRDLAP